MLRFEHPDILWLLLVVPVLAVAIIGVMLVSRRRMERFFSPSLLDVLVPHRSGIKIFIKSALRLAALACLILALANPLVGTRLEEVKREGIDLFVAIDVSLSMKADDIKPTRLDKAKRDVSALLKRLAGDRVGLIVFAGDAFVQFPLTSDYAAADLFISAVDVESVPTPGTMIGSAIERALESFSGDLPTQKAIIIVSDGENTEGDVLSAVEEARDKGVKVYTIGMGTLEGGPIPIPSPRGGVDYKRDRNGTVVVTKLDESMLRQIANSTDATYYRATSGGNQVDEIFEELTSLEKTEFGAKQVSGFETRYQIPLGIAILFLIIEVAVSERRGRVLAWVRRLMPATVILTLWLAPTAGAQTVRGHIKEGNRLFDRGRYADAEAEYKKALEKDPTSEVAHFNLGDAHYRQDRFDQSIRSYAQSAMNAADPLDRSAGYYNLGNAFFKSQKLDEAIEAYKQALRYNPNDNDARHNLEVARRQKEQQDKQQQQNQQQQNQQKQNQQQQRDQQQQQDQQQKDDQQQDQRQNQQGQDQQDPRENQARQTQNKNRMDKDEAERILQALRNNEKELQKKLQKREAVKVSVEKDW